MYINFSQILPFSTEINVVINRYFSKKIVVLGNGYKSNIADAEGNIINLRDKVCGLSSSKFGIHLA